MKNGKLDVFLNRFLCILGKSLISVLFFVGMCLIICGACVVISELFNPVLGLILLIPIALYILFQDLPSTRFKK